MFARNIDNKGRIVRGIIAVALLVGAACAWKTSLVITSILALAGAFTAFEAIRGWCGLRACGIKTKI